WIPGPGEPLEATSAAALPAVADVHGPVGEPGPGAQPVDLAARLAVEARAQARGDAVGGDPVVAQLAGHADGGEGVVGAHGVAAQAHVEPGPQPEAFVVLADDEPVHGDHGAE